MNHVTQAIDQINKKRTTLPCYDILIANEMGMMDMMHRVTFL